LIHGIFISTQLLYRSYKENKELVELPFEALAKKGSISIKTLDDCLA